MTTREKVEPIPEGDRPLRLSAVVLAAGRSLRMGRDKALLAVDGEPQWRRQREVLARAGAAEIFLSVRPEQAWAREARGFSALLHDATPSCGPISGITAALERAAHPHLAVLAIDLPKMTPRWFTELSAECEADCGVVGRRGDFFEPLAAIYPKALMGSAWEALAGGKYSLQALVARAVTEGFMRAREITTAEEAWFENWNEAT